MENTGINVGHLLQLQRDLTGAIDAARRESVTQMTGRLDQIQASLVELKQKQDIANGRVGKLERAHVSLRARLDGSGGLLGSLTRAQKAKLVAAAVVLGGGLLESLHQLLPKLVALLGAQTPPTP